MSWYGSPHGFWASCSARSSPAEGWAHLELSDIHLVRTQFWLLQITLTWLFCLSVPACTLVFSYCKFLCLLSVSILHQIINWYLINVRVTSLDRIGIVAYSLCHLDTPSLSSKNVGLSRVSMHKLVSVKEKLHCLHFPRPRTISVPQNDLPHTSGVKGCHGCDDRLVSSVCHICDQPYPLIRWERCLWGLKSASH